MWHSRRGTMDSSFGQRRWKSELVITESPEVDNIDSPSARFKSNFAKEVVQDIRQNKIGRFSHPGYVYKSRSQLRMDNMIESKEHMMRSRSNCDLLSRKSVLTQAELPSKDENLAWMSATTFKRILDKQEVAEVGCGSCGSKSLPPKEDPSEQHEERLDLLRNMMKMKDCLNLDFKEERQWTNVCSIIEQRKAFGRATKGNVIISQKMVFGTTNDSADLRRYQEEVRRLKEQNQLLSSEIHSLRKQMKVEKTFEKEIETLRTELKSTESTQKTFEIIAQRLMSLLEHMSGVLSSGFPVHKKLVDRTRVEMMELTKKSGGRLRPELKCISNRPSRSSLKECSYAKHSRSISLNPQLNLSSLTESTTNDSSLALSLNSSGSFLSSMPSTDSKSKKYYENIEVFESLYKDSMGENYPIENAMLNKSGKAEKSSQSKVRRQASFKNGSNSSKNKPANSSLVLDDSKNMSWQKTHKIIRSVKWLMAKERSLNFSPNKKY